MNLFLYCLLRSAVGSVRTIIRLLFCFQFISYKQKALKQRKSKSLGLLFVAGRFHSLSNSWLILFLVSRTIVLLTNPNFLLIRPFGIVTILCNLITESTVNPVPLLFSECFLIMISLSIKSSGILLEIKAIITWLYFPISFVKKELV